MKRSLKILILSLIIIGVIIGGCFYFKSQKPKIVKIAIVGPLTGELAEYGKGIQDGALMAVNEFNESQRKIKIEVVLRDTKRSIEEVKKIGKELVEDPKIMGVIGPVISSMALNLGPILENGKLVMITPSATNPKVRELGDYIFRACPADDQQGENLGQFVVKKLGYKKIAIVFQEDEAYSKGLAEAFEKKVKTEGGEISVILTFLGGTTDFSSQVGILKEKNPETLFLPDYPREAVSLIKALRKEGLSFPIIGGDGLTTEDFLTWGGEDVEGTIVSSFFDPTDPRRETSLFVRKYEKIYSKKADWLNAYAYDSAKILLDAISKVKKLTREEIKNKLYETSISGATGFLSFDKDGERKEIKMVKLVVEKGEFKIYSRE